MVVGVRDGTIASYRAVISFEFSRAGFAACPHFFVSEGLILRSAAVLALASTLLYGAVDTTTPQKSKPVPSTKSKAVSKSKTGSKSKTSSTSKASSKSKTSKSSAHPSTTAKSGKSSKSKTAGKRGKGSHSASNATWRSRQLAPTPERYKEIQSALMERGYLKKDASGVWDADSTDALRRFQHDQSLDATGKLNSLSLIALGLGPKHPAPVPAPAAPSATPTAPPAIPTGPQAPAAPSPETVRN
jgi:hypothetical protein